MAEEKPTERTEEQILGKAPIMVELGGERYEIRPLPIARSRAWRERFASEIELILDRVNVKTDSAKQFAAGLRTAFLDLPQAMGELVFAYAANLPRKKIERTATDAELIEAFKVVMRLAFPFGDHLMLLATLGRKVNPSASAPSTN